MTMDQSMLLGIHRNVEMLEYDRGNYIRRLPPPTRGRPVLNVYRLQRKTIQPAMHGHGFGRALLSNHKLSHMAQFTLPPVRMSANQLCASPISQCEPLRHNLGFLGAQVLHGLSQSPLKQYFPPSALVGRGDIPSIFNVVSLSAHAENVIAFGCMFLECGCHQSPRRCDLDATCDSCSCQVPSN